MIIRIRRNIEIEFNTASSRLSSLLVIRYKVLNLSNGEEFSGQRSFTEGEDFVESLIHRIEERIRRRGNRILERGSVSLSTMTNDVVSSYYEEQILQYSQLQQQYYQQAYQNIVNDLGQNAGDSLSELVSEAIREEQE